MVSSSLRHFRPSKPNFSHAGRYSSPIRDLSMSLVVVHGEFRNLNLRIRTGMKSMCSPLGNATINSLINAATFLLEITSHSHSLTPSTDSSILIAHVALHLHLTAQTPVVLNLFTAEVRNFRRQNLAAALYNTGICTVRKSLYHRKQRKGRRRLQTAYSAASEPELTSSFLFAVDSQFYISWMEPRNSWQPTE